MAQPSRCLSAPLSRPQFTSRARGYKKQQLRLKPLFSSGYQKVAVCYHIICFTIFRKQLYQKKNGGLQRFCGIRQLPIFIPCPLNYPAPGAAVCMLHHNPGRPASVRQCRPENAPPERFLLRTGLHPSPAKNAARLTVFRPKRKITERKTKRTPNGVLFVLESGSYLSFRAVASQVLSAYKGLTSVFGMGTGGTP